MGEGRSAAEAASLLLLPEWLVSDAADVALGICSFDASVFDALNGGGRSAVALAEALTLLIGSSSAMRSPHVSASLSEVLLRVFLPTDAHPDKGNRLTHENKPIPSSSLCAGALATSPFVVEHLPRALMGLYGSVERTGFYEKLNHRFRIMGVLRFLWEHPSFRSSLVEAASEAEGERARELEEFANGIVKHTGKLLEDALDAIEQIQESTVVAEDEASSEERREDARATVESSIGNARGSLQLARESLTMLEVLSSSAPQALLRPAVVTRLVSMLLRVLFSLAGDRMKSISIGRDLRDRVGFNARELLASVVRSVGALSKASPDFAVAAAGSGMAEAKQLRRVEELLASKRILEGDKAAGEAFAAFCSAASDETDKAAVEEEELGEIPSCFEDPLLYSFMEEPVRLATSGIVMDRTSIQQQLLNKKADPFTNQPLEESDLQPLPRLGELGRAWAEAMKRKDAKVAAEAEAEARAYLDEKECRLA